MILSQIILDPAKPETMSALSSPDSIHRILAKAANGQTYPRWRLETDSSSSRLLVLSQAKLNTSFLEDVISHPSIRSLDYDPFVERLKEGQQLAFHLKANPIRRHQDAGGHRRHVACKTEQEQLAWLYHQGKVYGFEISGGQAYVLRQERLQFFRHPEKQKKQHSPSSGSPVILHAVTFQGILRITDLERFKTAVCNGIGHGKGFGLGMLSLFPRPVFAGHAIIPGKR